MLVSRRGNTHAIRIGVLGGVLVAGFGARGTARGEGPLPIQPRPSVPLAVERPGDAVNQAGGPQLVTLVRDGREMTTVKRYPRDVDAPAVTLGPLPMDIVNGRFSDGLTGWTVSESGGGANPGQVLPDNDEALMLEGDSFLVTLQQTFLIPDGAELLRFHLIVDPGFDETDDFIPDAFEASLLNAGNSPVVPAWDPFATSFFNMQEDGTMNLGSTTNWDGLTATVDISGIPVGTEVTLFFDLIGADADTAGGLRLDNVFALEPIGCGDGFIEGIEECDDGNPDDGDGCSSTCTVESGWDCTGEPSACTEVCGDGIITGSEECDDGNLDDGDGCSSICVVEEECVCSGEPSMCACPPVEPPDPLNRLKNRYISFNTSNAGRLVKFKVTLTLSLPHPGLIGSSWWVKSPVVPVPDQFPRPALAAGECVATLGSATSAAEIDWDAAGCRTLHVTGCPIEPTSEYEVRAAASGSETAPLTVITILRPGEGRWWGDTVGIFNGVEWTAPQGTTNIDDAFVAIQTFKGGQVVPPGPIPPGNVAHLFVPDVEPGNINTVVNFADVQRLIFAFQGEMYPFGPADADGNCP